LHTESIILLESFFVGHFVSSAFFGCGELFRAARVLMFSVHHGSEEKVLDFDNSEMEAFVVTCFDEEVRKRHIARVVSFVSGDARICFARDGFNSSTTFPDDDTTMWVPEWDGVSERGLCHVVLRVLRSEC
jgi:hypothetical protein